MAVVSTTEQGWTCLTVSDDVFMELKDPALAEWLVDHVGPGSYDGKTLDCTVMWYIDATEQSHWVSDNGSQYASYVCHFVFRSAEAAMLFKLTWL